ncbi:MAG: 3-deoxy-manno-octulosonate cytidylyltransferase [Lachnospiraceae bacterium]|nr:3-deoxy-manno-octulosonate cytidylyltransferase [Lachnospiraceae bacterium]
MKVLGVIASRYGSSRLPGKALKDICGRPMIWWVYHSIEGAEGLDKLIVATDDQRIVDACNEYGIETVMTRSDHREAANRLQEVSQTIEADYYIQINGDEPLLSQDYIKAIIPRTIDPSIECGANLITKMTNPVEVMDPSNIKVVFDDNYNTCYMSRTPIPYPYRSIEFDYYKHIGIIGYTKKMLDFYATHAPGKFERIEGIATLRFTDYRKELKCIEVKDIDSLSVDTQMDLDRIREVIRVKLDAGELQKHLELMNKGK